MNVAMWGAAIRTIPRVEKAEWDRLDIISRWLIAGRAGVLVITFIPCLMVGLLAIRSDQFDLALWLLVTIGLLMAHATNNFLNDITDYSKGLDRENYFRAQYGPQPLEHGLLRMRGAIAYTAVTGALALAAGGILVSERGLPALALLGAGAFFVLFYTWPLKYIGLGELAVVIVWGPLMIWGGYYVVTGDWSNEVLIASIPYGLGATTVIFGKHIDKLRGDKERGIHTLPVIVGETAARNLAIALFLLQYALVAILVAARMFTPALLVVVLALPTLKKILPVYRRNRPLECPERYPRRLWPLWFVALAFMHNRRFGGLFLAGLALDTALERLVL